MKTSVLTSTIMSVSLLISYGGEKLSAQTAAKDEDAWMQVPLSWFNVNWKAGRLGLAG